MEENKNIPDELEEAEETEAASEAAEDTVPETENDDDDDAASEYNDTAAQYADIEEKARRGK